MATRIIASGRWTRGVLPCRLVHAGAAMIGRI
jgi:hypothetical protein